MSNEFSGNSNQAKDDAAKEEKPARSGRGEAPGELLTNTPGSPRVPTPGEMAESPNADGQDGRIGLKEGQKPKDAAEAQKK